VNEHANVIRGPRNVTGIRARLGASAPWRAYREGMARVPAVSRRRVALAAANVALALGLAGCAGGSPNALPSATASGPPELVHTNSASRSLLQALVKGKLVVDGSGCVQIDTGSTFVTPAWPLGYSVRDTANGFAVLDAQHAAVAVSGEPMSIGGGNVAPNIAGYTNRRCVAGSTVLAIGAIRKA
jgi:hypothetical protein